MESKKKAEEARKKLARLAADFRKNPKSDAKAFLKKADELTREYYRVSHPELL